MRNRILLLFLGTLLFTGCIKEDLVQPGRNVPEGEPALVNLKMDMATMGSGVKARAMTHEQEKAIENLRVMVFKSSGEIVTNKKHEGNPGASVKIETYSGNNRKICIVANVFKEEVDGRLAGITTYQQLKESILTAVELDYGVIGTRPLMMTACREDVEINPGTSTLPTAIKLGFLSAKLTLTVRDNTPEDQQVFLVGWDVVDASARSYILPGTGDANPDPDTDNSDGYWLTTDEDYPFETTDAATKTSTQTLYLLENRRGGREDRTLPESGNRYENMHVNDGDHRGKGWYKPKRATAIQIKAMHKTTTETKQVKAYIYLGADNHSDYNILRGNHYSFTVTVNGLDDIRIDSSVDYYKGDFMVDHGTNLVMDAHPDFRPMRIRAVKGKATMEILDASGKAYNETGFAAKWLKISPLNLMYHQVKQGAPNAEWQQAANPNSKFVRAKYIPHKSVRTALAAKGGWNAVPAGKDDDDAMTFADATYRMCYKITDIPFTELTALTAKTLNVYADEFLQKGGSRAAKIRFTFYKEGGDPLFPEVKVFDVSQEGYLSFFDETNTDAGLTLFNENGTPSSVKKKFAFERTEEVTLAMNPGIAPSVQRTNSMQWGFVGVSPFYNQADKYRNGKFLTANTVYTDVTRQNNEPSGFGTGANSYKPMYGNHKVSGTAGAIPAYTGATSGTPYYYYPNNVTGHIYHPIYKSSAARYCHEKNRDMNGDGIIDASESHWYLPSIHQLLIFYIANGTPTGIIYWSSTEVTANDAMTFNLRYGDLDHTRKSGGGQRVRCIRDI